MAVLQGSAKSVADGGFYPTEIAQSLRFNDNDSAYLSRTPSTAGNRKTWTWSGWVKYTSLATYPYIFSAGVDANNRTQIIFSANQALEISSATSGANQIQLITGALFRDPSAWYHIVVEIDTTQATASNRAKVYVNGEQVTSFSTATYCAQNYDTWANSANAHYIGRYSGAASNYFDGYLAEVHFTDGTAYTADDFGEFKNGVWVAKTPSVTYGTNGFYLNFSNSGALGTDSSGNSNTWTPTNLAATDVMLDSPTNNFATLNPLATRNKQAALAEGSLYATLTAPSTDNCYSNVKLPTSGKWYWETYHLRTGHGLAIGITKDEYAGNLSVPSNAYTYYNADGTKWNNNSGSAYGSSFFATSTWYTVGVYYDADAGTVGFTLDGVDQGTAFSSLDTSEGYYACASNESGSGSISVYWNFGQDSSFAGNKTPQGYTDANGIGDFYYAPPTGYLALCTANLPEPAISPANGVSPSDYFTPTLYTGNASTLTVTGLNFEPNMLWMKRRDSTGSHFISDIVRGAGKSVFSDSTQVEYDYTSTGTFSFNSDGFTWGGDNEVNRSGSSNIAWTWSAGGTPVTNTDGTITSSVSANTESGFSIVTYTGNLTSAGTATVGHGLNSAPDLVITKRRDGVSSWVVRSSALSTWSHNLLLDSTASQSDSSSWGTIAVTDTTFGTNYVTGNNVSGHTHVAYCFHSVEGFSKIGKYTGNGSSTDGTFVYTGFRPAFILVKGYTTSTNTNWFMLDNTRDPYNQMGNGLFANQTNAERNFDYVDFLSNGFKLRNTLAESNGSGVGYIYMAFAEMPFRYSNAR